MFNLVNCHLQRSFSRGRYFNQLCAKARFACARGPRSFCFSWRSRHVKGSHSLPQIDRSVVNWGLQHEYPTTA
jgi:hypothetical protein